jgi:hypothetical protein
MQSIKDVTEEMSKLLGDSEYRLAQRRNLSDLSMQFAKPGASNTAAKFIISRLLKKDDGTLPMENDEPQIVPFRNVA